jgi:hypothetical protein
MLRRNLSQMLTASCILMRQMRQMVPVTVGGDMAPVRVEGMKSVPAECVVSKSMAAVVAPMTVAAVAPVTTMAATSYSQGYCS